MFKVGDIVRVKENCPPHLTDHNKDIIGKIFTVVDIELQYVRLKECSWWVHEDAVEFPDNKSPIERKIAHLYKLYEERNG